ncbi:MAG: HYR domain-containing protein, partial [Acidobacteria bacterium]|nr:HYR domain-containing protein [Acidobacteriota bacterium]
VVNNHLRSLNGLDSLDGAERSRVRQKRLLQAEGLAAYVQRLQLDHPSARLVVLGDFNAFAVNDGQIDVLGIVRGAPAPAHQVVAFSPDEVTPDLVDAAEALPAEQRYSYVFDGNAQALDHILFSAGLSALFRSFEHARVSADFPEAFRGDPTHPLRLSDHDPSIVYFAFARDSTPPVVTTPGDVQVVARSPSGAVVEYPMASALDAVDGAVAATCDPPSGATFGFGVTLVICRAVDRAGNQGLATFTVTVLDATTHGLMVGVGAFGAGFGTTTIVATAIERDSGQTAAVFVGGLGASGAPGTFHATRIDAVGFFDTSASPESAAIDTVRVVGAGVWNGSGGYTFELIVVDRGEPGRTRDSASIVVRAPGGPVVFERLGNLTHGNVDVMAIP